MKNDKLHCLILRKTKYSENDLIFEVLDATGSIHGFFARGARKIKSRFSGVIQIGQVVYIAYNQGKNLNHPTEITIDSRYVLTFYSKNMHSMNFYTDILLIIRAVAKDLEEPRLFEIVVSALGKAEKGCELLEVYNEFLTLVLEIIDIDTQLICYFSNQCIREPEFYYSPSTNRVFTKKDKPKTVDAELITRDSVFEKQYLQKLIYEHINHKISLKF